MGFCFNYPLKHPYSFLEGGLMLKTNTNVFNDLNPFAFSIKTIWL